MRKKRSGIILTSRDFDVLEFLFQYKVGTIAQLARYPFKGASYDASRIRLSQLMRCGYLKKKFLDPSDPSLSWHIYYSLKDKSWEKLRDKFFYTLIRHQKASNHPLHDLELVNLGEWLRSQNLVTEFFSENMLQCCEELKN